MNPTPSDRLASLGHALPDLPVPAGNYVPARRVGRIVTTSSISAKRGTLMRYLGRVGTDLSLDDARLSATAATLNCLAVVADVAGSLDRIKAIVRVVGYINSAPDFFDQHKVMDAASDLLRDVFGDAGRHTRAAIGVAALPANCSVGVELTAVLHHDAVPDGGDVV